MNPALPTGSHLTLKRTQPVRAGLLDESAYAPIHAFVLKVVETKMNLPWEQLLWRAILANWFVCLAVWMAARIKSESAKILMIWWCMFTFITSGYEHSIANMCGLMLGIMLPHGDAITWSGYWYNLGLATLGNIIGGGVFVKGLDGLRFLVFADHEVFAAKPADRVAGVVLHDDIDDD